jgi:hypothetical protein
LPNYLTIQKPYFRPFSELSIVSFVATLRSEKFFCAYFKRWSVKVTDWLAVIKVFWIKDGLPEGNISDEDMRKFQEVSEIFVGAVRNVLLDYLFDSMMHIKDAKALWDHLNIPMMLQIQAKSCISWRALMTTRWLLTRASS